MPDLDQHAAQAARAVGRYYGETRSFAAPAAPPMSCALWFKRHWRQFPATAPDGGTIIDGTAIEVSGFLGDPAPRLIGFGD